MDTSRIDIYHEAIGHYGMETQLRAAQEECAELIVAISHVLREIEREGAWADLAEEVADVSIMITQLRLICGPAVDRVIEAKLRRLRGRIDSKVPSVRA